MGGAASGGMLRLERGRASAVILTDEGGVVAELRIDGSSVLARTPWADEVVAGGAPAPDEDTWVRRWRGGWQLCFPTAGLPDPLAQPTQGFHGAASQAPWHVTSRNGDAVTLEWQDDAGLRATRRWMLADDGLLATTTATNDGADRELAIAEHLILGGDLLAPLAEGVELQLEASGRLALLDYAGEPTGESAEWPAGWDRVTSRTPARVAALLDQDPRSISLVGPALTAHVTWEGMPHALLWEELGRSSDEPWNGAVMAVGIEPTTTPHGAGTGTGTGLLALASGATATWSTRLRIAPSRREDSP